MNQLYAGFSRVDITPMCGIGMGGYYIPRTVEGVLDNLEINAIALACGEEKVVLLSVDHCGIFSEPVKDFREHVSEVTGIPLEGVYIHSTHTHTSAFLNKTSQEVLERDYYQLVYHKLADAAKLALGDLKPTKMGWGIGHAPNVAFVRRFRMRDGSVQTNPGVNNPDIVQPIGDVDERVSVLRFERNNADNIVLVNFANHPDTVGGCKISADWPGFVRRIVEKTLDNVKCIFFNGAEGDVNHVNVHPTGGYLNDMFMDFDDVSRGYGHARYIGRVVAGGVLQAYDKVKYIDVDKLQYTKRTVRIPSNMPSKEEIEEAHRINVLHEEGKDDQIPYTGMMLTTVVAEAARMVRLENGPEYFDMDLHGIAIGDVAFIGIPGEPFTGVGRGLKDVNNWELVIPTCLTNGVQGYFPMKEAYDEGGYEARSSEFASGVAELIVEEGTKLLSEMKV